VAVAASPQLLIRLQPVWMRSPNSGTRGQAIESIIVHHTGGPAIGPAINEFLHGQTSAHYLIDTDGQIVKMVLDARRANHAGVASWNGNTNVNDRTIGIEIVNAAGAYPAAQYTAVTGLLTALTQAFTTIVPWDVIGHSDVATNASGRLGRKSGDPGAQFEWSRVEALGLGMSAGTGALAAGDYGGFFVTVATGALRLGDNDSTNRFGGAVRPAMTGDIVLELQTDLQTIGYAVGTPDGDFGQKTHAAVEMFQEHFFAGGRGHKSPDGRVDAETARLIKAAVAAHP
jgi:N-acetyl-anhydromuramyl-L-alanine amidase AmpD